ncbi:hypothetical protein BH10BAC5_BH10BAC5_19100 [soil metagenome]
MNKILSGFSPLLLISLFLLSGINFFSCSSVHIRESLKLSDDDWRMANGNPEKTNVAFTQLPLKLPLKLLWQFDPDAGMGKNSFAVSDGVLFANTLRGEMFSVDISSGKSIGRIPDLGNGAFGSPLVYKNRIINTFSGDTKASIQCYDITRALTLWQKDLDYIESSPVGDENFVYTASTSGSVYCLDVNSGNIKWTYRSNEHTKALYEKYNPNRFYTSPVLAYNSLFAGGTDGFMYCIDANTGSLKWKMQTGESIFCDASAFENKIYFGSDDKNFYCVDLNGNTIWKRSLQTKFVANSTFYNGMVIIPGIDGFVYSLSNYDGSTIWKFETKGAIWAPPLLQNNKIFIGSYDKNFYCLNAEDGRELWKFECEGRVKTAAVVWKNFVFAGSEPKNVYCFKSE